MDEKKQISNAFQTSKLNFGVAQEVKLVDQRRTVSYKADRPSYSYGENIIIGFGSTTEWIYGANSYVKMNVNITGADTTVGIGSAVNVIDEVKLTAKSGIEIEYLRDVATLANIRDTYTCGDSYLNHTGTMMGYPSAGAGGDHLVDGFDVCIPLHHISGFMGQDRFIPMSVLGGLELNLKLNNQTTPFVLGAGGQTWEVKNVELVCDTYRMTNAVLKHAEKLAHAGKMLMMYDTYEWNRTPVSANTSTSVNLEKAFTKVLSVMSRVRESADITDEKKESIGSATRANVGITSYQYRVGSESHPNFPITTAVQAYAESLKGFNNLSNCVRTPHVDYTKYINNHGVLCVSLERDIDSTSFLSGVSTNNKNSVSLEITTDADCAITTWTHFVRLLMFDGGNLRIEQ